MPGPKRTPTAVLKLRGSALAKRRAGEVKPPPGVPAMPAGLSEAAAAAWGGFVSEFGQVPGLLTVLDRALLETLATTSAELADCDLKIAEHGRYAVVRNDKGVVLRQVLAPWTARRDALAAQLARLLTECGATPASRSKVVAAATAAGPRSVLHAFLAREPDPFAEFDTPATGASSH